MRQLFIILLSFLFFPLLNAQTAKDIGKVKRYVTFSSYGYSSTTIDNIEFLPQFGVQSSIGYQWKEVLGIGVGVNIHFTSSRNYYAPSFLDGSEDVYISNKNLIIPLFVEVRGVLSNKKRSPFYSLQVGHGMGQIHLKQDWNPDPMIYGSPRPDRIPVALTLEGAYLVYPSIGVRLNTTTKVDYTMEVGMIIQKYKGKYSEGPNGMGYGMGFPSFTAKTIAVKFGIVF